MKNLLILFFALFFLFSCDFRFKEENGIDRMRNKIVFFDNNNSVQDSIEVMNSLMSLMLDFENLPNYFIDENDFIYVCNTKTYNISDVSKLKSECLNSNDAFKKFSNYQIIRFYKLTTYLKNNYITSCYKHRAFMVYLYGYKQTEKNNFEDQREIFLAQDSVRALPSVFEKVKMLDNVDKLILLGPYE